MDWQKELLNQQHQERNNDEAKKILEDICKKKINDYWDKIILANKNVHHDIRLVIQKSNKGDLILFPQKEQQKIGKGLFKSDMRIDYKYDYPDGNCSGSISFDGTYFVLDYYNSIGCDHGGNHFQHKLAENDIDIILENVCMQRDISYQLQSNKDLILQQSCSKREYLRYKNSVTQTTSFFNKILNIFA